MRGALPSSHSGRRGIHTAGQQAGLPAIGQGLSLRIPLIAWSIPIDVIGELAHESHQVLDVPLLPICKNRTSHPFASVIDQISHPLALPRDGRLANPAVGGTTLAIDQIEDLQLRDLSADRRVIATDAVSEFDNTDGAESLRRALADWLSSIGLVQAGAASLVDRLIGYYEPYATSHEALNGEHALFDEVRNAAVALVREIALQRAGRKEPDEGLVAPRDK